ncbi:MAG TPA: hypothetical protein DD723_10045 [Candidatus Omnitrophica bacterium]|uniref:PilZ domain-containing protein n=1 Tax=candidate division CPR1 bacterium GW2011_GWA2_42_17 TaxID=1618341 RepID=A0A0G1C2R9_9BACT|nr:MAG: hypothetical protein UV05_C0016G0006 [candidate division CPR1 bacterium GW2011_GWA2_42_17]HBR15859.1 hypothetical protein [Candidatus Omnitrophota bacterium]
MKNEKENKGAERRKYTRFREEHLLQCHCATPDDIGIVEATMIDFSEAGALFNSKVRYNVGDLLRLTMTIEGLKDFLPEGYKTEGLSKPETVDVLVAVERVQTLTPGSSYDIGVSFVGLDKADRIGLGRYIERRSKNKKGKE